MQEFNERNTVLFKKWLAGEADEAETAELILLFPGMNDFLIEKEIKKYYTDLQEKSHYSIEQKKELVNNILNNYPAEKERTVVAHRVHFLKTAWFRYAAAVLVVAVSAAVVVSVTNNKEKKLVATNNNKVLRSGIEPGGEKAVLTLADGSKIILDNAANGNLAQQGNAEIIKLANGQLAYNLKGSSSKEVMLNTMATPKGGQYQLTLPDGTKVWLNAASSITYPAVFMGDKRNVKIDGEVYFEVAKNKQKPFIVDVDGKSLVEVLGTSFNINSYTGEENIKTTLLEGRVKVSKANQTAVLNPGQQAQIATTAAAVSSGRQLKVLNNADIEKTLAWKNGLFNFNGADLYTVMRQLERWYDIKVQYKGSISNVTFEGKMYRNVNLLDVLEVLQEMGVKFELNGKNLIVL